VGIISSESPLLMGLRIFSILIARIALLVHRHTQDRGIGNYGRDLGLLLEYMQTTTWDSSESMKWNRCRVEMIYRDRIDCDVFVSHPKFILQSQDSGYSKTPHKTTQRQKKSYIGDDQGKLMSPRGSLLLRRTSPQAEVDYKIIA